MEIIEALFLGILQGITEFLPISSSGHLVLAQALLKTEFTSGITFEIVVHFGTLLSIIVFFKKEIAQLLLATWKMLSKPTSIVHAVKTDEESRFVVFILLSMIPAVVIGFTFKNMVEAHLLNPTFVGLMWMVTGTVLYFTKDVPGERKELTTGRVLLIGLAQAVALLPGISRSGSTIATGLYLRIPKESLANFSFLMVIPVIAGAMLLEVVKLMKTTEELQITALTVGFLAAFISGYYALKYLIHIFRSKGIHPFAYYCWTIGALTFSYFFFMA